MCSYMVCEWVLDFHIGTGHHFRFSNEVGIIIVLFVVDGKVLHLKEVDVWRMIVMAGFVRQWKIVIGWVWSVVIYMGSILRCCYWLMSHKFKISHIHNNSYSKRWWLGWSHQHQRGQPNFEIPRNVHDVHHMYSIFSKQLFYSFLPTSTTLTNTNHT